MSPCLRYLSITDEFLIIDPSNLFTLLGSIWNTLLYCHKKRIDIAIDLEFYSKFTTIMSFLSGAPWRMGFYLARFWRNSLVNVPVYFNYSRHILEIYNMFAQALHIEGQDLYPKELVFTEEERKGLSEFLINKNIVNFNNTIALNIHASDLALCRRWPLPKFVSLVEQFLAKYDQWNIILTGVKSEKAYSQDFLSPAFTMARQGH